MRLAMSRKLFGTIAIVTLVSATMPAGAKMPVGVTMLAGAAALGAGGAADSADGPDVRTMVSELARDSMQGRGIGTDELEAAQELVRGWLEAAGLAPGFDDDEWLQRFDDPNGDSLANVVGRIPGRGEEWLVLGAHYDGLGLGAPGSEHEGQIHPGADDNASGVAALVRIARALAASTDFERTVYVVAFSGEESGLLGSRHFVDHPPRGLGALAAMLNLDTVGGLENGQLIVFGTGTAEEFPSLLRGVNHVFRLDLAMNSEGAGASDHASFFSRGIPVLHFFTGAKAGYHRPGDAVALVNVEGTERVADFVAEVTVYLAEDAEPLTFRPVGAERLSRPKQEAPRRRVSFGAIPDFSRESGGILLTGVMPGSGAQKAGLETGDLIVLIDDVDIDNIYDFQGVLAGHAPGDTLAVRFIRNEITRETTVVLAERK